MPCLQQDSYVLIVQRASGLSSYPNLIRIGTVQSELGPLHLVASPKPTLSNIYHTIRYHTIPYCTVLYYTMLY